MKDCTIRTYTVWLLKNESKTLKQRCNIKLHKAAIKNSLEIKYAVPNNVKWNQNNWSNQYEALDKKLTLQSKYLWKASTTEIIKPITQTETVTVRIYKMIFTQNLGN
jgi:hypothetical protein